MTMGSCDCGRDHVTMGSCDCGRDHVTEEGDHVTVEGIM